MARKSGRGRFISLGSVLLLSVAALSLWLVVNTSGTWGYFSNTLQELATISTGIWEELPGQSGTSIKASKSAEGYWEIVGDVHKIGVRGEICVTNSGEQPTENLVILDIIQSKSGGGKYLDTDSRALVDLGDYSVLGAGESHCYPYDIVFLPEIDLRYRNMAYVTVTNHSGWIPGGHNCPGPDLCPFGPAPKSGFDFPLPPDVDNDNISAPAEYLPETGAPRDSDPEGKLFELPAPVDSSPPGEPVIPTPTSAASEPPGEDEYPTPTDVSNIPTPTPAPTQDASLIPTYPPTEAVNPTPTQAPTLYAGPPGCTQPVAYWLEQSSEWQLDQFLLGEMEVNRDLAFEILAANPQGDASYILAQQYIAALLNINSPADPTEVVDSLDQATTWFLVNPPGSKPGNPERKAGLDLADTLEAYNLGYIGPGSCVAELPAATPTAAWTPTSTSPPTPTFAPTMAPNLDPTLAATVEIPPTASIP